MTTERKIEIVTTLAAKAVEISETTAHSVFAEYSPHVDWAEVRIYKGGWKKGMDGVNYFISFRHGNFEDEFSDVMTILDKLQEAEK